MINIVEKKANKIPGGYSAVISFAYNPDIIDIIKAHAEVYYYNNKEKTWEVPIASLHNLIDNLCTIDTINVVPYNIEVTNDTNNTIISIEKLGPYKTQPFKHQLQAIQWGLAHDKGLLLDAPGLGKTLTTIYLAQERQKRFGIKHCLIVCGVNTLKINWKNEIKQHSDLSCRILGERYTKNNKFYIGSVQDRVDDLKKPIDEFFVITNIETFRNEAIMKELTKKNTKNSFDMVVLDEFHHCKNPQAAQTKNFLKLKPQYRLGLTGTLLTNSPLDCYTAFKWLDVETATYTNFKYFYCKYAGPFKNILVGYRHTDMLKEQLADCSLRRTKNLLDLPEKTIINQTVEMSDQQKIFYDNIVHGIVDQLDKIELTTTNLLALTTRLRQATSCPSTLTSDDIMCVKLDRCKDLVQEIISSGEKVVVFSVFKETINKLSTVLKEYKPLICTGDIKDNIIAQNINQFQTNEDTKLILCTTAKMGTGVTLNKASYAIFIDIPWTAADYLQCQDRIHRIGTDKPVIIYNLVTADTIDEHVLEIVNSKELVSDYIIDNKQSTEFRSKLKNIILDLQKNELL